MIKQFNVGDTVKYTGPCDGWTTNGVVKAISTYDNQKSYNVSWDAHTDDGDWITGTNLSLVSTEDNTTIYEAKEAKVALESEILRLIQDFNKKTTLEVQGISLDFYRALGGGCFYQVNVKVEI